MRLSKSLRLLEKANQKFTTLALKKNIENLFLGCPETGIYTSYNV